MVRKKIKLNPLYIKNERGEITGVSIPVEVYDIIKKSIDAYEKEVQMHKPAPEKPGVYPESDRRDGHAG